MADDPKSWLTKFLTNGRDAPDEKTRVMSKEQKEWTAWCLFLGSKKGLDIDLYSELAEIDMRLMMSYQGRRSDDIVQSLTRLIEAENEQVGIKPIAEYLKNRGGNGGGTKQ